MTTDTIDPPPCSSRPPRANEAPTQLPELPLVPLCADDCLGLCPSCGANRNDDPCDCGNEARDPRWDDLRALVIPDDAEHRPEPN